MKWAQRFGAAAGAFDLHPAFSQQLSYTDSFADAFFDLVIKGHCESLLPGVYSRALLQCCPARQLPYVKLPGLNLAGSKLAGSKLAGLKLAGLKLAGQKLHGPKLNGRN